MTDFLPGDRVLATADCLPDGGMLGKVGEGWVLLDGECDHGASTWFISSPLWLHKDMQMVLHHRPRPPRPSDPEPFTRSDGKRVSWIRGTALYPSYSRALTPDDAHRFATGFERIAAILEWEGMHGTD